MKCQAFGAVCDDRTTSDSKVLSNLFFKGNLPTATSHIPSTVLHILQNVVRKALRLQGTSRPNTYPPRRNSILILLQENARSTALLAVAKENKLDIELVETKTPITDIEYIKLNPLGRVPTFVGANGFILTESMAIAIYCESCPALPPSRTISSFSKMSHIINTVIPGRTTLVDYIEL